MPLKAYSRCGALSMLFCELHRGGLSAQHPDHLTPSEKISSTHRTGSWVGPEPLSTHMEKRKYLSPHASLNPGP